MSLSNGAKLHTQKNTHAHTHKCFFPLGCRFRGATTKVEVVVVVVGMERGWGVLAIIFDPCTAINVT